jgi:hypothetical protein
MPPPEGRDYHRPDGEEGEDEDEEEIDASVCQTSISKLL